MEETIGERKNKHTVCATMNTGRKKATEKNKRKVKGLPKALT
jgi:hypothetical protein